ncbi:SIR2 family protein [Chitinophaga sp. Ak27]|uniref:SIR2 family protein n=1 Tax=Chitinophaga sp. Ak27 TaxID=2726116 RepID=UPI00145CED42|nr:SIR2 family protein [Chitinophaga sp. Ak27]NLU92309.1 hypothetical protein [Chitinophaga sp. Ak27]
MKSNHFTELLDKDNSIDFLAHKLKEGELVLFLGSGTSMGFGLPNWLTLVNLLREEVNLPPLDKNSTADMMQTAVDEVEEVLEQTELIRLIQKYLYMNFDSLSLDKVLNNHLLVAVSALLMGSKRGHVTRVVTLNYDNMLEWFLSLFGFVVKTVYKLPQLEGSEDVRIYHPHGFIPNPLSSESSSDFVILSMDSVDSRLGDENNAWFEMTRHMLSTGICLFIGMSANTLSDRALSPLLVNVGKKTWTERPLGIWIIKDPIIDSKKQEFLRKNIIPQCIENEEQIVDYILKISQRASQV